MSALSEIAKGFVEGVLSFFGRKPARIKAKPITPDELRPSSYAHVDDGTGKRRRLK